MAAESAISKVTRVNELTEEDFEDLMRQSMDGVVTCKCPGCDMEYDLEPDGYCICDECGARVESPLLAMGMI